MTLQSVYPYMAMKTSTARDRYSYMDGDLCSYMLLKND